MLFWLSGLAVTLLTGIAATTYLWLVRRRNDELAYGLHALSGLRWREFSQLLLAALDKRGLRLHAPAPGETRDPRGDFTLAQGDRRWLLSCKHGSAYRIGIAPVEELAAHVRLSGAAGGILATEGQIEKEGREAAHGHNIEVLDGPRLWGELKPLIEDDLRRQIVGEANARARRHVAIAWLASLTLGALVATALARFGPAGTAIETPPPAIAPAPAAATPEPASPAPFREPSENELEQQRRAVSRALSSTPGVIRGVWQTRLTLSVDYDGEESAVWPRICQQVELYPTLRTVRVQLNPPADSRQPVRWRQCKTM